MVTSLGSQSNRTLGRDREAETSSWSARQRDQAVKIIIRVVIGALVLACTHAAAADNLASFATGGYASGLRTQAMMDKIDTKHYGMISRDEWIAFQNRVFDMLDRDHNGKVDEAEYLRAKPNVASLATGGYASGLLTEDMFTKIASGHDVITRDDFIKYHLKIFEMMNKSSTHKGMIGPQEFFATGGKPVS
jgi:hypothetical protein